jgi:transcriptional regulator
MLMGERHPQAKLQKEDILYIRSSNLSGKKLAELFGVTNANISSIRNRNTWTNI